MTRRYVTQGRILIAELKRRPLSSGFVAAQFKPTHGRSIEHDGTRSATYTAWRSMRARCNDSSRSDFKRYGGRGISVCSRWESFSAFVEDMGEKPAHTQLGRIDNDGCYEPDNCRWETATQQARNRRTNVLLVAFGETKCLAQWCDEYGIRQDTLTWRLKHNVRPESALTVRPGGVLECLREDEKLIKGKHASGCVTWAVRTVRPTKWTA